MAMTAKEQREYYSSYENPDDFFVWFDTAKKKYEDEQEKIIIGEGGSIDLEDILNGN